MTMMDGQIKLISVTPDAEKTMAYVARVSNPKNQDNEKFAGLLRYCIQHGQSSPYNPQSNGHAERNVVILKQLIIKTDNEINSKAFLDGISQLRNTPRED